MFFGRVSNLRLPGTQSMYSSRQPISCLPHRAFESRLRRLLLWCLRYCGGLGPRLSRQRSTRAPGGGLRVEDVRVPSALFTSPHTSLLPVALSPVNPLLYLHFFPSPTNRPPVFLVDQLSAVCQGELTRGIDRTTNKVSDSPT